MQLCCHLAPSMKLQDTGSVTSSIKLLSGRGSRCDVEAKMAAPLSTMKFWKPGEFSTSVGLTASVTA